MNTAPPLVLLTGATGYVGRRLLRRLTRMPVRVRCLVRNPQYLHVPDGADVDVVQGDIMDAEKVREALTGVDVAYYMIHSMGSQGSFEKQDRDAATSFGRIAGEKGVRRIVYLGGLGSGPDLSGHLRSRQEVGEILRNCGVETLEFRASIIIGSGSLSFELIRALVLKLPVMITPNWVRTQAQPIAIEDVLAYLIEALDVPLDGSVVFEIGGADRCSYRDLMNEYARQRRLRRWMLPVPFLSPRISSLWLGLVTPVYARIGRALIEGVRNETIVENDDALRMFSVRPRGMREAIARAISNEDEKLAASRWNDALSVAVPPGNGKKRRFGKRLRDVRVRRVAASPSRSFAAVSAIGGERGWYFGNWIWRLRGAADLLIGGVGMRRGRPHPDHVDVGDPIDFWRVEAVEPGHLLRMFAEMKLPGRAWLQFEVKPTGEGSEVRQTAVFDPVGLAGNLYWYILYPIHVMVFWGMLRGVGKRAESTAGAVLPGAR